MKKWSFYLIFFLNPLLANQPTIIPSHDQIFLLTYQCSGTNLVSSIIQYLNKNPIRFMEIMWRTGHIELNRLGLELDYTKPTLYRTHKAGCIPEGIDQSKNKLLMILRNYKENFIRIFGLTPETMLAKIIANERIVNNYIVNLQFFENWKDPSTKLLIYYEDLITTPFQEIKKIASFLDVPYERVEDLFENYDAFQRSILSSYQNEEGKTTRKLRSSGGDKVLFHTSDFPLEILQAVDQYIQSQQPDLWNKYLYRFKS